MLYNRSMQQMLNSEIFLPFIIFYVFYVVCFNWAQQTNVIPFNFKFLTTHFANVKQGNCVETIGVYM